MRLAIQKILEMFIQNIGDVYPKYLAIQNIGKNIGDVYV